MPIEGISMTTVFSLVAVGIALALSTYIGAYYLRPIFDIDALLSSVVYDIATMYDLAYTLPGEVTMQYFGPSSCKWNYNKGGSDISSFYCINPSAVIIKSINVNKEYLLVYDDIYLDYDSKNQEITNWIINSMGRSSMAKAIGYPRISYLAIEMPYYNREVSKQTDTESSTIGYGSLALAPFAGSYTDNAMAAAQTPYSVQIVNHSFIVSKIKVGNYYYTLSNYQDTPLELQTFIDYLAMIYNDICASKTAISGYYIFPKQNQQLWINDATNITYNGMDAVSADEYLKSNPSFLMLSKGNRVNAYISGVSSEKLYDAWTFDSSARSLLGKNDLMQINSPQLTEGLFSNAYRFSPNSGLYLNNLTGFTPSAFSISAWVYLDSSNNQNALIVSKFSENDGGYKLSLDSNNMPEFLTKKAGTVYEAVSNEALVQKKWYHLVGTFNGTHNLLYVNSQLKSAVPAQLTHSQTAHLSISSNALSANGFRGIIDEVLLFDSALTPSEVSVIYSSMPKNNLCSENIMLTLDNDELYNELNDYWNFDSDTGNNVLSALGRNNLTKQNNPLINDLSSKALQLDGNSYLSSSIKPYFDEFSVSFYIKPQALGNSYQYIISTNKDYCISECSEIIGYSISINPNHNIQFHFANSYSNQDTLISAYHLPDNQLTHVIVSYNQGTAKIYINGILSAEKSSSVNYLPQPFYNLTIGSMASYAPSNAYSGLIDELKIFGRELSSSQANYVYSNPDKLVIDEFLDNVKINEYVPNYCFDINELAKMNACQNINEVVMSPDFIKKINEQTNFYAGWNSCIYPYLLYNSSSKELAINAILSDYNPIKGGCSINE
jgi:hypothetical protein